MQDTVVFLDRDGTINEDVGYLSDPSGLVLIDGAPQAIKKLNILGVKVVVVSNQSGVGRGYYKDEDVFAVNERMKEMLKGLGATVDAIYYCAHHPDDDCGCRKPKSGLIEKAVEELSIDTTHSYVVGDKGSDVELAHNMKAKGVLVLTGKGAKEAGKLKSPADFVAKDLNEAVSWILSDMKGRETQG